MNYNIIAKSYNELYKEEQLNKLRILEKYLKIKKESKLLDIGCGTTISTNYFKCKAIGIDPSLNMLKQGYGKRIQGKAENLPFKDKSFDVIISVSSVHNFDNLAKAIKEILRVKKPNAQIAITLLKRSKKYQNIKKLLVKNFNILKEIDEEKDTIFIMN